MKVKRMLLSISTGALAAFVMYNTCKGEKLTLRSVEITSDRYTLTIEAKFDYGETGVERYVWQQFDDDEGCFSRSIEYQECPNARKNDGIQYSCNGLMFRDYDCDGIVDEFGHKKITLGTLTMARTPETEQPMFLAMNIDGMYLATAKEMEEKARISLEEEVQKWREQREVPPRTE